jgi:diadenosine tetraphosphate (Ap4A) HIT family hydrolase
LHTITVLHISMKHTNSYSHFTAKERISLSFPAKILFQQNKLVGSVLDFGCGHGKDVELLSQKNVDVIGYDPYYFPHYPNQTFDTILCFYVLNVLEKEEQAAVLMEISKLLKPSGTAYFAVRRDIVFEGYRMHKIHQQHTFQCNVLLPYLSIYKNDSCEIYAYQHYTMLHAGNNDYSPFFMDIEPRELVFETATAFSIFDKFPVSKGHILIIPKRLVSNYFELTFREQSALWFMVNKVKIFLQNQFNPDGFNTGINTGEAAGQTIAHVHIHVIPRYKGDVENPKGGIRGVIPNKKEY